MRYAIWLLYISCLMSTGCGSENGKKAGPSERKAYGPVSNGGVLKLNEEEYLRSLYPLNITEVSGHRIANQIYEGLVRLDQADLTIQPNISKGWDIDSTKTLYTFHLRGDVKFHDNACFAHSKGRWVKAADVKYCLDRLCAEDVNNKGYEFIKDRIHGAIEYHTATAGGKLPNGGCKGISVLNDSTIQIKLTAPYGGFLNLMSLPFAYIYPPEAVEKYGIDMRIKAVGTGPFILKQLRENDVVILLRNPDYWDHDEYGNQLPYLDAIRWSFISDQKSALLEFKKGKLDMIYRPPLEMLDEILDREGNLQGEYRQYQLQEKPSMTVQFYCFKNQGLLFNNKKLRQAFNYAVDRQKIVNYTLKGSGFPGIYGVVPPAFAHFDASKTKGYGYDPEKARKLMADAGYPGGKGFPKLDLQINSGGGRNEQVAEAVQKMLSENLQIKINITKMPFAQHLEAIETSKAEFYRFGWIADYPDPDNFLMLFYSKYIPASVNERSYLNTTRYKNEQFDEYFEFAQAETDETKRNEWYAKADQTVTEEAPVLLLFYDKDRRLLQPSVKNFPQNAMEYRNLRDVYKTK